MSLDKVYAAILFDLDGTLVESFKTTPLPGRAERIASLREQGVSVAICTNQAGPIWRLMTGNQKYPTPEDIDKRIWWIFLDLKLEGVPWFVSLGDERILNMDLGPSKENVYETRARNIGAHLETVLSKNMQKDGHDLTIFTSALSSWRKPEAGMLVEAAWRFDVPIAECLYVGDRDEDKQAAEKCGMPFIWAHDFFEREDLGDLADIPF